MTLELKTPPRLIARIKAERDRLRAVVDDQDSPSAKAKNATGIALDRGRLEAFEEFLKFIREEEIALLATEVQDIINEVPAK